MRIVVMKRLTGVVLASVFSLFFAQNSLADAAGDYEEGYKAQALGDFSLGMPLLKRSADAGYALAQSMLAELLEAAGANQEALEYYNKAADQGDPRGELGLAKLYAAGKAVKQDTAKATELLKRAAEKDYGEALKAIVSAYTNGAFGLPVDHEQANVWNKRFRVVEDKFLAERAKINKEKADKEKAKAEASK